MSKAGHMYTNLMGSACFQLCFDESKIPHALQYPIMGHCMAAMFLSYRHFFAIQRISANRLVNSTLILFKTIEYNGIIFSCDAVLCQLCRQSLMGSVVFCHHQYPRCISVDTMHNTRAFFPIDARKLTATVIHQSIDQCACIMTRCRMDNHSLGFIYHNHVRIFIKDIQRNIRPRLRLLPSTEHDKRHDDGQHKNSRAGHQHRRG